MAADCDVAIIGFGPVGATLANFLGMAGLSVFVVEREAAAYHLPRAVQFDDEVMRVFQAIGLAEEIGRDTRFNPGMRFVNAAGKLMMDWPRPPGPGPQGWLTSYRFHQPLLERALRDGVGRFPSVSVRNTCEAIGLEQDGDCVRLRLRRADGGQETLTTRYVVGCDGGRSFTKAAIGGGDEDLGFRERWLVTDVILKRPMPELGDHSIQYCDPERPATYVRGVGDRRRWEIALGPDDDAEQATRPDAVWRRLSRFISPADAEIERAAVYTFHSTLARRWRHHRVLIAGDAAHQTPPFLGQGMCAGIRDAANLAWKLVAVTEGRAEDALLDTYQSERAPHVREYIELAVRLGRLINATSTGAVVDDAAARGESPQHMASIRPPLGPGALAPGHPAVGMPAPQPVLTTGRWLDDQVGWRWALLLRAGETAAAEGLAVIDDPAPALQDWMAEAGVVAALVRPDRYVAAVARSAAELPSLVETARAWGARP